MIFLDQPIQVGYSWSDGDSVNTSPDAAKDGKQDRLSQLNECNLIRVLFVSLRIPSALL
jgi:hypothetical protein